MKPKTVISLLAVVLILAAASYFLLNTNSPKKQDDQMGSEFFKDLPVNDIAAVTIHTSQDKVELKRGPEVWVVKNRHEYPADFVKISDFIKKIKRLKIGRVFEANDDVLNRQKLHSPQDQKASEDQKGTRISLFDEKAKPIADFILGNSREGANGGGGQYMRYSDKNTVYLVSDNFSFLEQKPEEWLEREVINVDGKEIEKVTCYGKKSDEVLYQLARKEHKKSPELISPPKNETVDKNKIDQVFDALGPLNIEDINGPPRKAAEPLPNASASLVYQLYDGRMITVHPSTKQGDTPENSEYYLTLKVDYAKPKSTQETEPPPDKDEKEAEDADKKSGESDGKDDSDTKSKSAEEVAKEAKALNDKLRAWTFKIAKWQYDSFILSQEGLMQTKEENTAQ